jgi:hypothetical protein
LEADARRAKRERRSALAPFNPLQQLGFNRQFRASEYVRRWRADGAAAVKPAFVPLKFALGEA